MIRANKAFLNKADWDSLAAIGYHIEITSTEDGTYFDASMNISDCSRTITLDLGLPWYTRKDEEKHDDCADNGLFKIRTMMHILQQFEKDYIESLEEVKRIKGEMDKNAKRQKD